MQGSFKINTGKGFTLLVHWTILLVVGWIVSAFLVSGKEAGSLLESLLFLLLVAGCMAMHEMGHALAASLYDVKARLVILLPTGGVPAMEKLPENPRQEVFLNLAGPLVNITMALSMSIFINFDRFHWNSFSWTTPAESMFYSLFMVNVFLGVFNLLPAFPLDGGRILRALLASRMNYIQATAITSITGKVIGWILMVAALLFLSPWPALAGIYLLSYPGKEEFFLGIRTLFKGIKLKEAVMEDHFTLQAGMSMEQVAGILASNHSKQFLVMDGSQPVGSIRRFVMVKTIAECRYEVLVGDIMQKNPRFLDGAAEVDEILGKLADDEDRLFPVVENSRYLGAINLRHIIEYLLIRRGQSPEFGRLRSLLGLL